VEEKRRKKYVRRISLTEKEINVLVNVILESKIFKEGDKVERMVLTNLLARIISGKKRTL